MKLVFKKNILKFAAVLFILVAINACKKEGTGGKSSINGNVQHHDLMIPNATVYIKYGATEFPGTDESKYDASTIADANAFYEFTNLRKGDYYLYAVGFDNQILEVVRGGIGISLKYNQQKGTHIPVTE